MNEILADIGPGTLIAFDLDNTLIEAAQEYGSDQWFDHELKALGDAGLASNEALAQAISAWKRVNAVSAVKAVEARTPELIAELQSQGVAIMGLTARPSDFGPRTAEQLASVGIDLSRTAPARGDFDLGGGLKFEHGIEFVTGQDKGVALLGFLKRTGFKPARIVFVDDKLHNVQDVERALDGTRIEHVSFRYGALDEIVRAYDPAIAEIQAKYFGQLLDDAAASRLK